MATAIEEELILDWTTAIEALDLISIQEIFDIQPELLWTPLQPLAHLENDFSHFINKLEDFKLLGTSIRPVYALHHILFDYGLQGDEWAPERIELVDFILKVCCAILQDTMSSLETNQSTMIAHKRK